MNHVANLCKTVPRSVDYIDRLVADTRTRIETASDKRKRLIFEIFLCIILPCIIMVLHTIVQGHRFDIGGQVDFGLLGC